jgi:hypothetical protein
MLSAISTALSQDSSEMSRFCAVPMTSGTRSTYIFHRFLISTQVVLPFCRATSTSTVLNRNRPSGSVSIAWMNSHRCHGISSTPTTSVAKSTASNPRVVARVRAHPHPQGPGRPVTSGRV